MNTNEIIDFYMRTKAICKRVGYYGDAISYGPEYASPEDFLEILTKRKAQISRVEIMSQKLGDKIAVKPHQLSQYFGDYDSVIVTWNGSEFIKFNRVRDTITTRLELRDNWNWKETYACYQSNILAQQQGVPIYTRDQVNAILKQISCTRDVAMRMIAEFRRLSSNVIVDTNRFLTNYNVSGVLDNLVETEAPSLSWELAELRSTSRHQ